METTNRYSDKELEKFKKLIEEKIIKANSDLNLLKSSYMNDGNNGTEDTSPTFKAFEEVSKTKEVKKEDTKVESKATKQTSDKK